MDSDSANNAAYDDADFALADNSNPFDDIYPCPVSARHTTASNGKSC
jgi:hypothetical protein